MNINHQYNYDAFFEEPGMMELGSLGTLQRLIITSDECDACPEIADPSYFGAVTFGDPETVELFSPGNPEPVYVVTLQHGEWRPPERLARFLPEGVLYPD